ncbi:tyrosine-type recombinase/integrase [Jeongeupia wiesaeckerbachi]|uniref:tyrosine-type recombinase/integrase n=1 Tax=Jeongeupia wiesaeckerbachi TaxID=3051218 RepID=UPI003D802AE2
MKELTLKALTEADAGLRLGLPGGLSGKVRVSSKGVSVDFQARFRGEDGRPRDKRLGSWPKLKLAQIFADYRTLAGEVAKGNDPIELERRAREADERANRLAIAQRLQEEAEAARRLARMTYGELFTKYCAGHVNQLRGKDEIIRRHHKDVLPRIGGVYVDEVTRQMVAGVGQTIADRGARRAAHLTLGDISACFKWAIETALLDEGQNPAATIKKTRIGDASKLRERVLSEAELRELLQARLPASNLSPSAQAAIKVMLATLCRVGELMRAQWRHLDLAAGLWTVPAENAKNGEAHVIHLSAFASAAFLELQSLAISSKWIFPGRSGETHVCDKTLTKQIGDRQRGDVETLSARSQDTSSLILPGGRWTSHDLRRTGATLMGELGVAPYVIDKCQNHVEKNRVTRTYQRQELLAERQAAFELLGKRLALLADPEANNVVALRRA